MRTPVPALMTDLYELTMAAGYWAEGRTERAVFELFARRLPARRGYLVTAGVDAVADYLVSLRFTEAEIAYLRALPAFAATPAGFFDSLAELRFTGDMWAVREGELLFPNEPILSISAPIIEAQLVETAIIALANYPISVATKASRMVEAAAGRGVIEFGARRAHGTEAALIAAGAAYAGGCVGTSNVEAGMRFGIPVFGTVAHSWIMSFDDEVDAFRAYRRAFPHNAVLLIDTYDTLRAARRVVEAFEPGEIAGVRIDSGDLGELARGVREIFDAAGFASTRIYVSGDLNEWAIAELVARGAPVDAFGVGTDLTTVRDAPALGIVYKLVEIEHEGRRDFRMKLSEGKMTYPGRKQVWRIADDEGRFARDVVGLWDEPAPEPGATPLLAPVVERGRRIAPPLPLEEVRARVRESVERLPARLRGLEAPETPYPVEISARVLTIVSDFRKSIHEDKQD
jgi:nicotinate phosphoribosyltransferase